MFIQLSTYPIIRLVRLAAMSVVLVFCGFLMFALGDDVVKKLDILQKINADSPEWNFSQAEVEYYKMLTAIQNGNLDKTYPLNEIRVRFDIYYSRVKFLKSAPFYQSLFTQEEFVNNVSEIELFLEKSVPIIDGPDDILRSNLHTLYTDAQDIQKNVRNISLRGLKSFLHNGVNQRHSIAETLTQLGILTSTLLFAMALFAFIAFRLHRISENNSKLKSSIANRLETIIGTSLDAILVVDSKGIIIGFNGAATAIFGYSKEEAVGQTMSELIIPEKYRAAHERGMRRYIKTGQKRVVGAGRIQLEARHKKGHFFPIEVSLDAIEQDDGKIFVSFIRDITVEVLSQQELVEARDRALAGQKAKADFLAIMSHEMRTPLNGLLGTLFLLKDTDLNPKQQTYLDTMESSGRLLLHHVNDVLDISRFEAGKTILSRETVNITDIVEEILDTQRAFARQNGNMLSYKWVSPPINQVYSDPTKLRQILLNLVGNANKFTFNGSVSIQLQCTTLNKSTAEIEIRVIDTGIGISEEDKWKIFDDFETLDTTYGRQTEGTGLGLGIARRMVEAMGGKIGVDNHNKKGSEFWFKISFEIVSTIQKPSPNYFSSENMIQNAPPMDVLMVEDNEINRLVLREMLTKLGHNVDEAENGKSGVEAASKKRYDAIFMDISMPVMDGIMATRLIRRDHCLSSNTPIIATTAHALPSEIETFFNVSMSSVLNKPIEISALMKTLYDISQSIEYKYNYKENEAMTHGDTSNLIDIERVSSMGNDLGADMFKQLLDRYINEADKTFLALSPQSKSSADMEQLVQDLHKIAGSSAALGAAGMQKHLNIMEMLGKEGKFDEFWQQADQLHKIWSESKKLLSQAV